MSNIKGTIVNVKDFLGTQEVNIRISGASESIFKLEEGREYIIPDFQREIRWESENLVELMNDINQGSKFLGNIIMLAAVYNYFCFYDGKFSIKKGKTAALNRFLSDKEQFSVEHFIANNSKKCLVKYSDSDDEYEYEYQTETKKYCSSIFNYIFIPKRINGKIGNKILQEKIKVIADEEFDCEYSNMVIASAQQYFLGLPELKEGNDAENRTLLDKYYSYDFKQQYNKFVSAVLDRVADRFSIE